MPDLNDVLKPLRDAADEVERGTDEVYGSGGRFAAEAFLAGARHALTQPIILRTPEELDALPVGSAIRAQGWGLILTCWDPGRFETASHSWDSAELLADRGPVELIRLPRIGAKDEG
jgi:hypothetical protein